MADEGTLPELPVCDGRTNREKLAELLDVGTETTTMDYKATIDLNVTSDAVEMARDVAAMRSNVRGGYLVYGVDGQGCPAHAQPDIQPRQFDEAEIRQKIEKYVGKELVLTSSVHVVDGRNVAVVYVQRAPFGLSPMEQNGDFKEDGSRKSPRFKRGDIFVRRGTQVVALNGADVARLVQPEIDDARRQAREEYTALLAAVRHADAGSRISHGAVGGLSWRLAQEQFDGAVIEALRTNDRVVLRAMLLPLAGDANALMTNERNKSELLTLLDRTISVLGAAIAFEDSWLLDRTFAALKRIYQLGDPRGGYSRGSVGVAPADLLLAIAARVEAAGALAIRMEQWAAARRLILQTSWDGFYTSWLRHAVTDASRGGLLAEQRGDRIVRTSLVSVAYDVINRVPALHPDLPDHALGGDLDYGDPPNEDTLLDSILQFDLAWCVLAELASGGGGISQFYPSFAAFYGRRVSTFAEQLVTDDVIRHDLLGDASDDDLRAALAKILDRAERESLNRGMFSFDVATPQLDRFLDA